MEIRTKTLLIICATLLGLIVVLLALSQSVVLGGFSRVEQQSVQKDTNRVLVALGNDLNTLDAVTTDWASRGDTLSAVRRYPVSVTWDKLDAATFERLQFNYIILYNRSGGFAVGSGYDLTAQHLTPVPEELATLLARDSRMAALGSSPGGGVGVVLLPEDPLMVAMRPITAAPGSGNSEGVLLMGRYIDDREVARLASLTQLPLAIRRADDPAMPAEFRAAVQIIPRTGRGFIQRNATESFLIDAPIVIQDRGERTLFSYAEVNDPFGNPVLILRMAFDRDILAQGKSTTLYFMWLIYAAGLAFGLITLVLLEKTVLSRVSFLSARVNAIGEHQDFGERVKVPGSDEIARLATDINTMLGALEESQTAVRDRLEQSEERYQILVESSPDGIVVMDAGVIRYVNTAASVLFGAAARKQLSGMAIERLVTPGALSLIREAGRRMGTATGQVLPSTEGEILRLDGQQVPVEMTGVAVRYGDTPVLQLVIRDITERKREGDALRQANKKLNILNVDTLNAIRNQVFTLNGYLSLMKEPASPDKAREYGDKAGEAIKAITAQLEFIRHYQNMGIQHSRWQKVHDAYLFALSHIAIGQIERYESVTGVEIFADPLLEQVFFGLIDNSLRHGKHVTRISLTSVEIEGALGIVFEDNGVGVPDAGKNAIFELKYGKGGGIGLFLIREVLGITGITIRETGTYGSGARFEIRVPKGYYRFGKR